MLDCFRRENSAREPAPPRQLDVSHSKISAPGSPGRASYSLAILSSEQSVLTMLPLVFGNPEREHRSAHSDC
jgi:hypothetical protein